jgi:hypothetical protein
MDDDIDSMTPDDLRAEVVRLRDAKAAGVSDKTYRAILALGEMLHQDASKEQRRRSIELYYVIFDGITRR